jgi:hypothetical protein
MSDSDIARSSIGKMLAAKLNEASFVGIGKQFLTYFDYNNLTYGKFEKINIEQVKYTLVNFWHSACGTLVKQLRQYKEIFLNISCDPFPNRDSTKLRYFSILLLKGIECFNPSKEVGLCFCY